MANANQCADRHVRQQLNQKDSSAGAQHGSQPFVWEGAVGGVEGGGEGGAECVRVWVEQAAVQDACSLSYTARPDES